MSCYALSLADGQQWLRQGMRAVVPAPLRPMPPNGWAQLFVGKRLILETQANN